MANNSLVYQFKISLKDVKPEIWRRIQVPGDYSFSDFHLAIQDAMGWYNCHLHEFVVKNPVTGRKEYIGSPNDDVPSLVPTVFDVLFEGNHRIPGEEAKISRHFSTPKQRATYMYDFGDGWEHNIVLEKILPAEAEVKYPVCLAGKRACPPEDCGGSSGYESLLEILSNPNHEEYAEKMEWLHWRIGLDDDEKFDPEKFDPKSVSFDSILWEGFFSKSNMASNSLVYQFKISLKNVKPKIWRRIQVPGDYSFLDFHLAIQNAMGWTNCHLHEFVVENPVTGKKERIGSPVDGVPNHLELALLDLFKIKNHIPEQEAKLSCYFSTPEQRATYFYDFNDGWQHNIVLEKILPTEAEMRYPACLAGKRACPPEDCGGSRGYESLMEIISNPNHEKYAEQMEWFGLDEEWLGEKFDPEKFDPKSVSFDSTLIETD